jgi:maleamate amidohydrolase
VTYAFIRDKPEPILESIKKFPSSCGENGWRSVTKIKELLGAVRKKGKNKVPIFYTANGTKSQSEVGKWRNKNEETANSRFIKLSSPESIVKQIAPKLGDNIVPKLKPSAFHDTGLLDSLVSRGIDTLLIAGCTTSGCVRATVVDAFSFNYSVGMLEECVSSTEASSHTMSTSLTWTRSMLMLSY